MRQKSWIHGTESDLERTDVAFLDNPEKGQESAAAALDIQNEPFQATIRYRGNDADSREALNRLVQVLEREQSRRQKQHWKHRGIETDPDDVVVIIERDISSAEARAAHAVGKWLPIMLCMLVTIGGLYTALDLFAGERERGTLETLLVSRLNRSTILAARFVLVLGFCLGTAWLALGSLWLGISQGWIQFSADAQANTAIPMDLLATTALLCIPLSALLGALLIATATLAPDLKTGQALSLPVMLGVAALAGVTALGNVELSVLTAMVPISGLALGIRDSIAGQLNEGQLLTVLGATTVHAVLALAVAQRLVQRESILFASNTSHRRKKGHFGIEAAVTYGIALVLFWFLGRMAMEQNLIGGMLFNQLAVIGGTALAILLWLGIPIKPALQLQRPHWFHLCLALIIGVSAPCLSWVVLELQSNWIPVNEMTTNMPSLDIGLSLIQILVLFAILPGICEELLFRGTIQGLLRQSTPAWARCIIVGALFGFFHLSLARILPTGILGVLLCFTAWRAQSLFVPIFIHIHTTVWCSY